MTCGGGDDDDGDRPVVCEADLAVDSATPPAPPPDRNGGRDGVRAAKEKEKPSLRQWQIEVAASSMVRPARDRANGVGVASTSLPPPPPPRRGELLRSSLSSSSSSS